VEQTETGGPQTPDDRRADGRTPRPFDRTVRSIRAVNPPLFLLPLATLYFAAASTIGGRTANSSSIDLGRHCAAALGNIRAMVIGPSALWQEFAGWLVK
jgi:hypothetical protein